MAAKDGRLAGKLALVTAGGGAIGRAVCEEFAREGAKVAVSDISEEAAKGTVESLQGDPSWHLHYLADVSSAEAVKQMFQDVCKDYGQAPDVVAHIAGGGKGGIGRILELTEENFAECLNMDLMGTFLVTQAAAKSMVEHKVQKGSIINMSSMAAVNPIPGISHYGAAKAGVVQFTKIVALELIEHGIRCNSVLPGQVRTPMFMESIKFAPEEFRKQYLTPPMGRPAEPSEISSMFVFLASDESSFITGAAMEVAGGPK